MFVFVFCIDMPYVMSIHTSYKLISYFFIIQKSHFKLLNAFIIIIYNTQFIKKT